MVFTSKMWHTLYSLPALAKTPLNTSYFAIAHSNLTIHLHKTGRDCGFRPEILDIEEVSEVKCITCYGRSIKIGGKNQALEQDNVIFVLNPLDEAEKFSMVVNKLYNAVGFSACGSSKNQSVQTLP